MIPLQLSPSAEKAFRIAGTCSPWQDEQFGSFDFFEEGIVKGIRTKTPRNCALAANSAKSRRA
jgi:hypothetical protein